MYENVKNKNVFNNIFYRNKNIHIDFKISKTCNISLLISVYG